MRIPVGASTSYRGRNHRPHWLALSGFLALGLAASALAYVCCLAGATWYASLVRPAWSPPYKWLPPAWGALCGLVGIAVWLIWGERYHRSRNTALNAYALQFLLNAAWAPAFFGLRSINAGLFLILTLWMALVWTVREFHAVRPTAAWLLLPYLAWISVEVALNLAIWRANP